MDKTLARAAVRDGVLTERGDVAFPRVIDATIVSDWRKCPHAFFRRHVCGLSKPGSSVHLHFGSVIARGLEIARRTYFSTRDTSDALHDACEAVIHAWGDFAPPDNPSRTEAAKTLSAALHTLQSYFREWPLDDDPIQIHVRDGAPCIEYSGALPIPSSRHPDTGEPILYAGRFDLIGDYQHSVWGLDDKTTGSDPNTDYWRAQWKLRSQFTGYVWLAREYGVNLKGFIVRGMGVMKTDIKLGWALAPRPPWMIDAWLAQLQADTHQMCQQYMQFMDERDDHAFGQSVSHPFSQRFDTACADFGGCSYLDLCSSEHPDSWLDSYEVRRWDPLTRQET